MSAVDLLHHLMDDAPTTTEDTMETHQDTTERSTRPIVTVPRHYEERRLKKLMETKVHAPEEEAIIHPPHATKSALSGQECVDRLLKFGGQRSQQRERLAQDYHIQAQAEVRATKPPPSFNGPANPSTTACLTLYEEGKHKLKKREAYQERVYAAMKFTPQLSEGTKQLMAAGQARPRPKKAAPAPHYSFKPEVNPESLRLLEHCSRQPLYKPPVRPARSAVTIHCLSPPRSGSSPNSSPSFSSSSFSTSSFSTSSTSLTSSRSSYSSCSCSSSSSGSSHPPRSRPSPSSSRSPHRPVLRELPAGGLQASQQHISRQNLARQRRAEAAIPTHVTGANWKPRPRVEGSLPLETQEEEHTRLGDLLQELAALNMS